MADSEDREVSCSSERSLVPTRNRRVIFTRLGGVSCIQVPRMAFLRKLPLGVERMSTASRSGASGQPLSAVAAAEASLLVFAAAAVAELLVSVADVAVLGRGWTEAVREGGRYGRAARSDPQSMHMSTGSMQWKA